MLYIERSYAERKGLEALHEADRPSGDVYVQIEALTCYRKYCWMEWEDDDTVN